MEEPATPHGNIVLSDVDISPTPVATVLRSSQAIHAKAVPPVYLPQFIFHAAGRDDLPGCELNIPIDWNMNPFRDNNWSAQLNSLNWLDGSLELFDASREPRDMEAPLALMMDWYRYHFMEGKNTRFGWTDKITGHRAMKIAYLLSQWQHGRLTLTPTQLSQFKVLAHAHLDRLVNRLPVKYSNHTFYQLFGIRALLDVLAPSPACDGIRGFVNHHIKALVDRQFDANGMHKEHSFGYQSFGIATLRRLQATQWFNDLEIDELLERAEAVRTWLHLPDGRITPIGDTTGKAPRKAIETKMPKGVGLFNQSGYCIVRRNETGLVADASYFVFSGAFNSHIHRHADDLSVYWFEGEEILSDPAKFSYNSDVRRSYVRSTRAHSAVEINGESHSTVDEDAYGSAIKRVSEEPWGFHVVGQVHHRGPHVTHTRNCLYAPGEWLVLLDQLSSKNENNYTSWLQLAPQIETMKQRGSSFMTRLKSKRRLRILQAGTASPSSKLYRGETAPKLQGWTSQAYGELTPSYSIGTSQIGRDVIFATLLALGEQDASTIGFSGDGIFTFTVGSSLGSNVFDVRCEADKSRVHVRA